jgi:uncharacterized Zn-finger protein
MSAAKCPYCGTVHPLSEICGCRESVAALAVPVAGNEFVAAGDRLTHCEHAIMDLDKRLAFLERNGRGDK